MLSWKLSVKIRTLFRTAIKVKIAKNADISKIAYKNQPNDNNSYSSDLSETVTQ